MIETELIGRNLSHYRIIERIGAGGMGVVYLARDTRLDRDVALKVLPQEFARDSAWLSRFQREAKVVAALNHPNIVTLYSIEESDGIPFLTMEFIEGQTLTAQLRSEGLPLSQILDLAVPITDALVAAHEKGIVHRDLKFANVMVTREGRVKVLDFGLAKLASGATVELAITGSGQVLGTVPFMAPEQLRGEPADARSGLFSLGIMLYELVTGQRPFAGESLSDVISSILRDTPVPAATLRPRLPRDLDKVIGKCLEKDPQERVQTARDLHNELRRLKRELEGIGSAAAASPAAIHAPLTEDTPSIAVLPFVNMSKDEENEYFADGLSEELINVLAKIAGLRVAARTSSFYFKGHTGRVADVGRELSVATILEGSVRKSGNRVRITAQLIKVSDGYHLWSETYDRDLEDIFAVQDDIAHSVVKELRVALLGEKPDSSASAAVRGQVQVATKGRGASADAYEHYLRGRFFVDHATQSDVAKGIGYFRQALELEPEYALAWVGLSRAYALQAGDGWVPFAEGYGRAREAAERALQLEPELAEGHAALGIVRLYHDWDWRGAESSMRRALELAPGNAEVVRAAAGVVSRRGRLEEGIALGRRAVTLDPLGVPAHYDLGFDCFSAGLLKEADVELRKALDINPQGGHLHYGLALVHLAQGSVDEAMKDCAREPDESRRLQMLALLHHAQGRTVESDAALRELIEKYAESYAVQIAETYAYRGESDRAFKWMARAYAHRDPGLVEMKTDPLLRNLHADPRWQPFLEKMGLAD
jgi:serine/threonine protein kinase/Flp pilus assembly protein TadD